MSRKKIKYLSVKWGYINNMAEFTGNKYITSGIQNEISAEVQAILWDMINSDRNLQKELDYLQVFGLNSIYINGKWMQEIIHKQEQPHRVEKITYDTDDPISAKIYVIDDISHCTMLFSHEY